jgi:hypothetical protein
LCGRAKVVPYGVKSLLYCLLFLGCDGCTGIAVYATFALASIQVAQEIFFENIEGDDGVVYLYHV